jgi:hypothetical protein
MSNIVTGVVRNGVIVPNAPLPEDAQVEIRLAAGSARDHGGQSDSPRLAPAELRKLPRAERQEILAAAAKLAEEDYRTDKELTGFAAFSEEELNGD